MTYNLEEMSRNELLALQKEIVAALKNAENRELKMAREAAAKAVAEYGFSLDDVTTSNTKRARNSGGNEPKYRNPADPNQTWSGRGRQPGWFKAAVTAGTDPSDMEI